MQTIDVHEVEMHLSELLEAAAKGESFIIAKAGQPMVQVTAVAPPKPKVERKFGTLAGQIVMPEDFDRFAEEEILEMFGLND